MGVLLLVRHGQASFGADDYDVLSPTGWEQGRVLGRWLAEHGPVPAAVVHGGMRRHRETWEALHEGFEAAGGALAPAADVDADVDTGVDADVDTDWAEFDHLAVLARYGQVAGDPVAHDADRRAFQAHFEAATAHWTSAADGTYTEQWTDFAARADAALASASARPGPCLVVTSGGVIAALAARLVLPEGASAQERGAVWARFNTVVVNSSLTRVLVGPTGARLLTFNEHPHLPRDLVTYR